MSIKNTARASKSTAATAITETLEQANPLAGMSEETKRLLLAELLTQKELVKEVSENPDVKASLEQAAAQLAEDGSVRNVAVAHGLGEDENIGCLVDWMSTKKVGMTYLGATFDINVGGTNFRGAVRLQVSDKKVKADPTVIERTKVWAVKAALASLKIKV